VVELELFQQDWQRQAKGKNMSEKQNDKDEMLEEYDFSNGVRGKYVNRLLKNPNIVILEPDVAKVFTDSESVNQALRGLLPIIQRQAEKVS
jgi:hypothetical protein